MNVRWTRTLGAAVLFVVSFLFAGPGLAATAAKKPAKSPSKSSSKKPPKASPNQAAVPSSIAGAWTVMKQIPTGLLASGSAKASGWMGKKAMFAAEHASFDSQSCPKVGYKADQVPSKAYLLDGFRVAPEKLGINGKSVNVINVTCGGKDWIAPAGVVIVKSQQRILSFWDGYFLEMSKDKAASTKPAATATSKQAAPKAKKSTQHSVPAKSGTSSPKVTATKKATVSATSSSKSKKTPTPSGRSASH